MDTIINVEDLGKKYIISHQGIQNYSTLRETITNKTKNIFLNKKRIISKKEEFWALRNINFDIRTGERIGIIGNNGAGKSTLLKLLSRITEPTEGKIKIIGKVASLLEVGTGFHPELTGRENIFLNGAILGMSRLDIKKKFDEIVAFAEIEKFLDTPVKRYSSGMYVRLAFSVAAHLEPDILLIDEVLAVGDAQFQKKSLGKMKDVSQHEERTIFFVSHNMNAIEQICDRVILLEKGQIKEEGNNVREIIKNYLFDKNSNSNQSSWENTNNNFDNPWFIPLKVFLGNSSGGNLSMPVRNDDDIWIFVEGKIIEPDSSLNLGYAIYNENGDTIYWSTYTDYNNENFEILEKGQYIFKSKIPERFLNEGIYKIEVIASLHLREWILEPTKNCPNIFVNIKGGLSDSPFWTMKRPGFVAPMIEWQVFRK